jgi:hypothetical protein
LSSILDFQSSIKTKVGTNSSLIRKPEPNLRGVGVVPKTRVGSAPLPWLPNHPLWVPDQILEAAERPKHPLLCAVYVMVLRLLRADTTSCVGLSIKQGNPSAESRKNDRIEYPRDASCVRIIALKKRVSKLGVRTCDPDPKQSQRLYPPPHLQSTIYLLCFYQRRGCIARETLVRQGDRCECVSMSMHTAFLRRRVRMG